MCTTVRYTAHPEALSVTVTVTDKQNSPKLVW